MNELMVQAGSSYVQCLEKKSSDRVTESTRHEYVREEQENAATVWPWALTPPPKPGHRAGPGAGGMPWP